MFQNLRSELVYTLNEQNSLLDFEETIFVNERSLFSKKKNPLTYRSIGEMEGRVRETNILLRVALLFRIL